MRALVYVIALTAASVAAPAYAMHPGARPGEAFTFKFSLGPVEGGRARMSIGKPVAQRGRHVIAVHGQAETTAFVKLLAHVDDDYKLIVDTGNLLPVSVAETERGLRERRISVSHEGPRIADVDFWSPQKQVKRRHLLPRIARDPLSGFFAGRSQPHTRTMAYFTSCTTTSPKLPLMRYSKLLRWRFPFSRISQNQ